MTDKFTSALLAALNESGEVKESDWRSIEAVLRGPLEQPAPLEAIKPVDQVAPVEPVDPFEAAAPSEAAVTAPRPATPWTAENRFAAMISSGMAKIRTQSS